MLLCYVMCAVWLV